MQQDGLVTQTRAHLDAGNDVPDDLRQRTPEEVFDDHLRLAAAHRFEEDIERNIAPTA